MSNNDISKDRWVVCPVCGRKVTRTRLTYSDHICNKCGTEFMACVTQDFATTILHENDNLSMSERLLKYQQQLLKFAD